MVLSPTGKKTGKVRLPLVFSTEYRPDIIKRAVLAITSAKKQPQGVKPRAGRDNTAEYRGSRNLPRHERTINVGRARLPRTKNRRGLLAGRVSSVPQAVGGPKAHPPKTEKRIAERINRKEKKKALESAIAATANEELVRSRHQFGKKTTLPIVVEDSFEKTSKTREVVKTLKALGLYADVLYAKNRRKIRAGKGKRRGRKYKKKKSLLMVTKEDSNLFKAARNLEGVEVVTAKKLNAELLAPGAKAGRLTLWSKGAIETLGGRKDAS